MKHKSVINIISVLLISIGIAWLSTMEYTFVWGWGVSILMMTALIFFYIWVNKIKVKFSLFSFSLLFGILSIAIGYGLKSEQGRFFLFIFFLITGFIASLVTNAFKSNFLTRYFIGSFLYIFLKFKSFFIFLRENSENISAPKTNLRMQDFALTAFLFIIFGLPVILVIYSLLISVNSEFLSFISLDFLNHDIFMKTVFAGFFFIYLASELYLLKLYRKEKKLIKKPKINFSIDSSKIILRVSILVMFIINLFYVFFILADLSGEIGNARAHFDRTSFDSYSDYAVTRFWSLILVTLINLFIIYSITKTYKMLSTENSSVLKPFVKWNIISIGVMTFGLVLSTLARLGLYVSGYGFTQDRLYGVTFSVLIVVFIALFITAVFAKKTTKYQLASLTILILYFAVMHLIPMNLVTHSINYNLYKSRSIKVFTPSDINISYATLSRDYVDSSPVKNSGLEDPCVRPYFPSLAENYIVAVNILKEDKIDMKESQKECMKKTLSSVQSDIQDGYNQRDETLMSVYARNYLIENESVYK